MRGGIAKCMVKMWGQEVRCGWSRYQTRVAVGG